MTIRLVIRVRQRTIAGFLLMNAICLSAQEPAVRVRRVDMPVAAATLATDIYDTPAMPARSPVILVRTPYGREDWKQYGEFFARQGYVFVAQDVRGRGASTGQHVPFLTEEADGVQTLDWIVAQPWSDGRVGMMGPSYGSFASMVLLAHGHPALKAVINNSGMIDLDALVFTGGALNLMVGLPWTRLFGGPRSSRQQPWDSLFAALPVSASFSGPSAGMIGGYPAFNQRLFDAGAIGRLAGKNVPVLHLTGWNDFLYRHTLNAFEIMRASAAEQRLIVGPWAHDQQQQSGRPSLAGEDFGDAAAFGPDSIRALALEWFDRHVRQRKDTPARSAVRVFAMGANRWIESERWPLSEARAQTFFLDSDGNARGTGSAAGAGRLVTQPAAREGIDEYRYDAARPVPTRGGANFHFFTQNLGPLDQASIEWRDDVLSYTTTPFERTAMLGGPIKVTLHVSSAAPDADFSAKLVLVRADGHARIVEDGIMRARFHAGRRNPRLLSKDEIVPVTIELGATMLTIPAGARLRLEISGGNFPKYDRNPQTGENPLSATTLVPAMHRVHHGPAHPSALTVRIAPSPPGMSSMEPVDRERSSPAAQSTAPAAATATASPRPPQPLGSGCLGLTLNTPTSPSGELVMTTYPVITATTPRGPAISAGVHAGDTVLAINGEDLMTRRRLGPFTPGSRVSVTLRRGAVREVPVIIGRVAEESGQPPRTDSAGAPLPARRVCKAD